MRSSYIGNGIAIVMDKIISICCFFVLFFSTKFLEIKVQFCFNVVIHWVHFQHWILTLQWMLVAFKYFVYIWSRFLLLNTWFTVFLQCFCKSQNYIISTVNVMLYKSSVIWLRRDSLNCDIRTSICSTSCSVINFYIAQIFKLFYCAKIKK